VWDYLAELVNEGARQWTIGNSLKRFSPESSGILWRDLPERLGDWKNAHGQFSHWAERGGGHGCFSTGVLMPMSE
jgi:hypothetical protein